MFSSLHWLRNELDYQLRNRLRLRRGLPQIPAETKEGLFPPDAQPEADRLVREYHLADWAVRSPRTDFAASLFYLQMLERALREAGAALPSSVKASDAGAGDWFYGRALYRLLQHYGTTEPRQVALDGVEVDAYALYSGFHSRRDWAEAYVAGLPGVRYLPGDIRGYTQQVDLALLLFPFLFEGDVSRWGLPRRYLRPGELLDHVWGLVAPGGYLLIANVSEAEHQELMRLLEERHLPICWTGSHESALYAYPSPRYLTVLGRSR